MLLQRDMSLSDSDDALAQNQKPSQKPTIQLKQWLHGFKPLNSFTLKTHILNFFISEGLFDVAKQFAAEAHLEMPAIDEEFVQKRFKIKVHIQKGEIDEAIQLIKQIKNQFQDDKQCKKLLFSLKCLKVIQLIKNKQIEKSIEIAKKELLPFSQENQEYIEQIERVMSLIAFVNLKDSLHYNLTTDNYKNTISNAINEKLLENNQEVDRSLESILTLGKWCERQLAKFVNFPHFNLGTGEIFIQKKE